MLSKPINFPYPYLFRGSRNDGCILVWPDLCSRCKQHLCESPPGLGDYVCSYGFDVCVVDKDWVIGGVIIRETGVSTPAQKKRLRGDRSRVISRDHLKRTVAAFIHSTEIMEKEVLREKEKVIKEYIETEQYKPEFLEPLKQEIQKGLSFVHDYKQLNSEINQNINVVIENRYQGGSFFEKLEKASEQEKAIYYAGKVLEEKLNIVRFLMNPEWLYRSDECTTFGFHGLVLKYIKIYSSHCATRKVIVNLSGKSYLKMVAHPQAVAVIPHTFIDNALKYSPRNGVIDIRVQDEEDHIFFSVASHGPRILEDEQARIFEPFYRGEAARRQEEEGAGYGLYVAQMIAVGHLGSRIIVQQESVNKPRLGHRTIFSIKVPLKAIIIP